MSTVMTSAVAEVDVICGTIIHGSTARCYDAGTGLMDGFQGRGTKEFPSNSVHY